MSRTLLYTVQRVLEKLNLDPVNSINDTEDSLLISREAESTFYDLQSRADWPESIDLIEINSVSDVNNPTALQLDQQVHYIESLRYDVTTPEDTGKVIRQIVWLEPEEFLDMLYSRNTGSADVQEAVYKDIPLFVFNNRQPQYYTSFDNEMLILDSYDGDIDTTLIGSKSICYGKTNPTWSQTDGFVIPVQDSVYPLYLSALSSACSIYLNSEVNQEDERRQQRNISRMRRESIRTEMEYFPRFKFGRKGNGLA